MKRSVLLFLILSAALVSAVFADADRAERPSGFPPQLLRESEQLLYQRPDDVLDLRAPKPGDGVTEMRDLLEEGLENIDGGLVSEGIKQVVSALAVYHKFEGSHPEADKMARRAEATLARLEPAIAMVVADTAWLDESGNQKSGSTLNTALQPSIILTFRSDSGPTVISNAPIRFEFVRGGGIISGVVNTSEYGQANCAIARLDSPQQENIIRAVLEYRTKGFTYRFKGVMREFVYAPPSRKATIVVLERSEEGISEDPQILGPVYARLADLDFDLSLFDARLEPGEFIKVYGGDGKAIAKMGLEADVSYLIVVLNDCTSVRQLEIGGRKMNLFVSEARATTRIIRIADGKIMYQTVVESSKARGNHGQGGSQYVAIVDVLRRTSSAMVESLEQEFPQISKIMLGSKD